MTEEKVVNRTQRVTKTLLFAIFSYVIKILISFVFRRLFIKVFYIELLGVNSLFTNILGLLSLAELGFSSVIVCFLYKPVAENDIERINSLMALFKKIYTIVGIVVLSVGLVLLPFINYFVRDTGNLDINLYIAYALFLINSVATYFVSYRFILFTLFQDRDKEYKLQIVVQIVTFIIQICVIFLIKNYYAYLVAVVASSILSNISFYILSLKIYPQVTTKNSAKLSVDDKNQIKKNVIGILYQKIASVILNSTDNIIISIFLGVTILGIYGNYSTITTALISIIMMIIEALRGSVGNFISTKSKEEGYALYKRLRLLFYWLSGFCMTCLFVLFNPFIKLWMGDNLIIDDYLYLITICLNFYFYATTYITSLFREIYGNFHLDKFKGLIQAIVNLIISLVLVKFLGLTGVLLGTIISNIIPHVVDPYITHKYLFEKKLKNHYLKVLYFGFVSILSCALTWLACYFIPLSGILGLLVCGVICLILPNLIFLLFYFKLPEFSVVKELLNKIFKRRKKTVAED